MGCLTSGIKPAFDGDSNQDGDDALGGGLDVGERVWPDTRRVVVAENLATPNDNQAAQIRQRCGACAQVGQDGRSPAGWAVAMTGAGAAAGSNR